jgi:monovalent cation/proton antiporter MnhG/PhaG subunit
VSENLLVDVLLAVGVGAELVCCAGVVAMRTVFDRLHYLAAASSVPPFLFLTALLVREGLSGIGLEAIAAIGLLFLSNPVLVHATARAARRIDYGDVGPTPDERPKR